MMQVEPQTAARKGADLMDGKYPGWWWRLEPEAVDCGSDDANPLTAHPRASMDALGLTLGDAVGYGLLPRPGAGEAYLDALNAFWAYETESRRRIAQQVQDLKKQGFEIFDKPPEPEPDK